MGSFNKSLLPLVKEDKDFPGTAPYLFGTDFAKRSKGFTNHIKEMRSSLPNKTRQNSEVLDCFFAMASPRREATEEGAEAPTIQSEPRAFPTRTETMNNSHTDIQFTKDITANHCTKSLIAARGVMPLNAQECPAGRLAHFQKNWTLITKDRWVLDTVKGYHRIPLNTPSDSETRISFLFHFFMQEDLQFLFCYL